MTDEPLVTDEVEDFDGTIRRYNRHAGHLPVATIPAGSPLPGDVIRTAWYLMDGPADRPHTVGECHVFIEQLLDAVGKLTGITNAGTVPPWEPAAPRNRVSIDREAEWDALTAAQLTLACTRGVIIGLPLHCEFCGEAAVWSTGDHSPRVACYDLRHIAGAESIGSGVPPELLLKALDVGMGQIA